MDKINAVFITGPSGNGSTTFTKLLEESIRTKYCGKSLVRIDMDGVISWYRKLHSALGREVRKILMVQDRLPKDVIAKVLNDWILNEHVLNAHMETILVSGFPADTHDFNFITLCDSHFKKMMIVRLEDEHETAAETSENILLLHLNVRTPLTERLRAALEHFKTVDHSPIEKKVIKLALGRISGGCHPIHEKIVAVEEGRSSPLAQFVRKHPFPTAETRTATQQ